MSLRSSRGALCEMHTINCNFAHLAELLAIIAIAVANSPASPWRCLLVQRLRILILIHICVLLR